jgi:hypothetical protein
MPQITVDEKIVTLVNIFTVEPENQERLRLILDEATQQVMRHRPGFVSASIHTSLDGTRVLNYAQWRSEKDFRVAITHPDAQPHFVACRELAKVEPRLYTVRSTESG